VWTEVVYFNKYLFFNFVRFSQIFPYGYVVGRNGTKGVANIPLQHTNGDIADWVSRLQRNEPHAFDGLYNKCSGYVSFVCTKFCNNKEDVEEIVQDTFVIAYKKANELRADTLLQYLRKIAVHECYRRRNTNKRSFAPIDMSDIPPMDICELNEALLPEDALLNKERQTQLLLVISKLPKNQREMIYLYYYIDFNAQQIALLTGYTTENVYMILSRARKSIKRRLEDERTYPVVAKSLMLLPLAALFVAEETIYVAAYVPIALTATATGAAAVGVGTVAATAGTSSIVGYVATACITVALITAVNVYLVLQSEPEPPPYTAYVPIVYTEAPRHTPAPTAPPPVITTPAYEPTMPPPTEAILQPTEPAPTLPPPTSAPTVPSVTYQPPQPTLPQPIDRTSVVLAALATAHTQVGVRRVLDDYAFVWGSGITTAADVTFNFYLFNEGSGDVLVGTAVHADGSG